MKDENQYVADLQLVIHFSDIYYSHYNMNMYYIDTKYKYFHIQMYKQLYVPHIV